MCTWNIYPINCLRLSTSIEISQSDPDVIEISQRGHVTVNEPHYLVDLTEFVESHTFRLDHAFDETVPTSEVSSTLVVVDSL